jgi:tetratricopeptide (TPR) repeat protein
MQPRRNERCRSASIAATSLAFAIAIASFLTGEGGALAQTAEAEELFNDGNRLMAQGKLVQACDAFEASNRLEPRAGTLLNLGACREYNGQLASAWAAYKAALSRAKDPRKRELAQAKVAALAPRISYLTVSISDDSRLEGLSLTRNGVPLAPMLCNQASPVDGGEYVIASSAPGQEPLQIIAHVPVEGGNVTVDLPRFKEPTRSPPSPAGPDPRAAATEAMSTTRKTVPSSSQARMTAIERGPASPHASSNVVPLVLGAGALALLGGGLAFERWGESRYAAAKLEMTSLLRRESLYNEAVTRRHVAEAFFVSGLVGAGTSVWLYVRNRNREHSATLNASMYVVPTAAGLSLSGQF